MVLEKLFLTQGVFWHGRGVPVRNTQVRLDRFGAGSGKHVKQPRPIRNRLRKKSDLLTPSLYHTPPRTHAHPEPAPPLQPRPCQMWQMLSILWAMPVCCESAWRAPLFHTQVGVFCVGRGSSMHHSLRTTAAVKSPDSRYSKAIECNSVCVCRVGCLNQAHT